MQTFYSHYTPCFPTADVTLLILYTVSSHCTTFSLFCRCDPSGSAHFLYLHCRCEIPDNEDFLLQPHTLSSYSRCSFSDIKYTDTFFRHCTEQLSLHTAQISPGTAHFLCVYCRCHTPHTTDFLLSPHTPSFYYRCSLLILYTFSHTAQPSLYTADATLLALNTFSTCTPDVTFLILQTFSSHNTPCLSATDVSFL